MNPLLWLMIIAPSTVLGAILFLWVYQNNADTASLERDRMRLEQMKFDRDFAAAWNGKTILEPEADEIAALQARIKQRERVAEAAALERCQKLERMSAQLNRSLMESGGSASVGHCQGEGIHK